MSDEKKKLVSLSDMADMSRSERLKHQLLIMDALLARAIAEKDFGAALRITKDAEAIMAKRDIAGSKS